MNLTKHCLALVIAGTAASPIVANTLLEEVIVTATKRAESAQDVPIAVTAIGGDALETGNFSNIISITSRVPSVSITNAQTSSGSTSVKIRGIGTVGNNAGFESSVGIFVDGVYQPRPGIALGEFVDMAQVEVLRGPQGTLFGRNTSVGALNVKSNAPVIGESEGFISGTVGDYDLYNVKAAYNIDAGDALAFRIAGSYRERDGVIDSTYPGAEAAHNLDRYLLRAQALWEPTEMVSLRVIFDRSENDEHCCAQVGIRPNSSGAPTIGISSFDPEDFTNDEADRGDSGEQYGISAELTVDTDFATFTWIPAFRKSEAESFGGNDFTGADMLFIPESTPNEANIESITQEFRVQGTGFDDKVDWLFGLFYSDEEIEETANYHSGPQNIITAQFDRSGFPPVLVGPSPEFFANNRFHQDGESLGIFTHNIISLTDNMNLTVGLRYTSEEKEGGLSDSSGSNPDCLAFGPFPGIGCLALLTPAADSPVYDLYEEEFDDDAFTYTVNLHYHLNDDISVYGSVSTGFKSGGINLDVTGSGGTFDSEEITSYEIGLKSVFWNGRVTANAAWYYMDLSDFIATAFDAPTVSFQVFNVDEGKSEGLELDVSGQIADNFSINASYAYTDASFPDDCAGPDASTFALIMCGNNLPNAPEHVVVANFLWDIDLSDDLLLTVAPNIRWEDESQPEVVDPSYKSDDVTMVDLSVSLTNASNSWSVELWGKNLLDEAQELRVVRVFSNGPFDDAKAGFISNPRTYGLTARYNF